MTLSYESQESFIKICSILEFTNLEMNKIDQILKCVGNGNK
jgi:hypothetical protein